MTSTPMLQAALMVRAANKSSAGETAPAAAHVGTEHPPVSPAAVLVARPTGVVHVAVAPLTPSGRHIPRRSRTVCRTRTRRLSVLDRRGAAETFRERRVCVRCINVLADQIPGLVGQPAPRDVEADLYSFLSVANLRTVVASCTTVAQTHEVGRLALMLFGPATMAPRARRTPDQAAVADLHDDIHRMRARLVAAERTDEERDVLRQQRETQIHNDALAEKQRRRAIRVDVALERQRRGGYLLPHERELTKSA